MQLNFSNKLSSRMLLMGLWVLLGAACALCHKNPVAHNNYLIFKGVFYHFIDQLDLYCEYPTEYFDTNHYGPLFSLIIAPFAVLPDLVGLTIWNMALSFCLAWAIYTSVLRERSQIYIYIFGLLALWEALIMQQFNIAIAAIMIASFSLVERGKDKWATLLILIGAFVKLYSIVCIVFILFSRRRKEFVLSFIGWGILLFCLPMFFSSFEYVMDQYKLWYSSLMEKNALNTMSLWQNISVDGMVRRIGYLFTYGWESLNNALTGRHIEQDSIWVRYSNLWVIVPAGLIFLVALCKRGKWNALQYKYGILASLVMSICLFSTGTEASGYIIAICGIGIWFTEVLKSKGSVEWILFFLAFVMSQDYLLPWKIDRYLIVCSLMTLPSLIIWLKLNHDLITGNK